MLKNLGGGGVRTMGHYRKKTDRATKVCTKTREEIRKLKKVETDDSLYIPDRRETSDIPGLPSG